MSFDLDGQPAKFDGFMPDLHKTYIDDEGYDLSHGHAYNFYGIDQEKGAIVLVRPDHCELPSPCWSMEGILSVHKTLIIK